MDACYDYEDDFEPIFQVVDAGTTLAGENPRADVSDGPVKVSGHLVPGSLNMSGFFKGLTNTMSSTRLRLMVVKLSSNPILSWSNTNPRFGDLTFNTATRAGRFHTLSNASLCSLHASGTALDLQTERNGQRQASRPIVDYILGLGIINYQNG